MKNYRLFTRYEPEEWETDIDWLAKRLDFLWEMRSYYIDVYLGNGLGNEKEDMYYIINNPEVNRLASKYNTYTDWEFDSYSKKSDYELAKSYSNLIRMKKNNKEEFLKKKNCNLYCYIKEHRIEDVNQIYENDPDFYYDHY